MAVIMVSHICLSIELGPICNFMAALLCLKGCEDHSVLKRYNGGLWKNYRSGPTLKRTEKQVLKCSKKLDPKKATGVDAIPPKVVKAAMPSLSQPICNIASAIICKETFPNRLKMAQVTPIFKKDDPFIPKKITAQ